MIYKLEVCKPKKEKDIHDMFDICKQNEMSSPFIYKNIRPNPIHISNIKEENIVDVKKKEDNLYNNPLKLFKVKIRDINIKTEIGIVDSFECKKRFTFVKCVSQKAKVFTKPVLGWRISSAYTHWNLIMSAPASFAPSMSFFAFSTSTSSHIFRFNPSSTASRSSGCTNPGKV